MLAVVPRRSRKSACSASQECRTRPFAFVALVLLCVGLGCSTHRVALAYRPHAGAPPPAGDPVFAVASVVDQRQKKPHELGVVRGSYGNVLKRLHTDEPVADLVLRALEDSLRARGLLAESSEARVLLRGFVTKLDCNYFVNREAHAHIELEAVDAHTSSFLWRQTYRKDVVESAIGAGIFADVDHLRGMAETAMIQAIDDAVADSHLRFLSATEP